MNLDALDDLIGGVPVSEQIGAAIERMAEKDHIHPMYATVDEIEELKRKVDMLINLVGDTPISEQINIAINNINS